jgi:trans-4-hydroxy-L-proline dehydratase
METTSWIDDAARVAALRDLGFERKRSMPLQWHRDMSGVDAASLRASEGESWPVRRGRLTQARLEAMRFEIDDLELLVGRLAPPAATDAATGEDRAYLSTLELNQPGQTGHCELDLDVLMRLGIEGMAREIRSREQAASGASREALGTFLDALSGFSRMIENAAEAVEAALLDAAPHRRQEMYALAESCRRVAHDSPVTFLDAIQLLWFAILGVMHADRAGLVVPGHLDRQLRPFYVADIAAGTLTRERALLLIEQLYLHINTYVPDGLAMSVMVGGRDVEGHDVTNDLSYLCLEAVERTNMIYPTVGVCWHVGTPEALVDLTVELMGRGYPTPAFFGDATIQKGLARLDVPPEEACRYINSTCVEITPSGASNVWVASPYYNTCGLLLAEIGAAADNGVAGDLTFDAFLAGYRQRLANAVDQGVVEQNSFRRARAAGARRPLQSVFTRDCVARGEDIETGGARYNWVECSFIGLANLADALYVIREEIFQQQRLTLAQVKAVLEADFEGLESTRQRWLKGYPKYGQGDAGVDALLSGMIDFITETCAGFDVEPNASPYVPGAFAWVMHERMGRETGATPDGRRAGFPFADGCGPAQGRESHGPTAAILSVTGWDHSRMIGGLAYNLKFNSSLFRSPDGFEGLKALILTYLRRGGFEVQVNVVDATTLKAAVADPESYRDLIVRIGGYADYFTRLSPEMQAELILRTEFERF